MSIHSMCPCRGQLGGFPAVRMVPQKAAERKTAKSLIKSSTYTLPLRIIRSFPQLFRREDPTFFEDVVVIRGCGTKNSKKSNKIKHLHHISAEGLRIIRRVCGWPTGPSTALEQLKLGSPRSTSSEGLPTRKVLS